MDERLRTLVEQIPEKAPRSKLEPHVDVIRVLRRKGRTYQEISRFFSEHLGVPVAASTIHAFVRVRARRRHRQVPVELPPAEFAGKDGTTLDTAVTEPVDDDVRARIEALKRRDPAAKQRKQRFEYDENEPLRLVPETKQKLGGVGEQDGREQEHQ
jgi:hypothetical protein